MSRRKRKTLAWDARVKRWRYGGKIISQDEAVNIIAEKGRRSIAVISRSGRKYYRSLVEFKPVEVYYTSRLKKYSHRNVWTYDEIAGKTEEERCKQFKRLQQVFRRKFENRRWYFTVNYVMYDEDGEYVDNGILGTTLINEDEESCELIEELYREMKEKMKDIERRARESKKLETVFDDIRFVFKGWNI